MSVDETDAVAARYAKRAGTDARYSLLRADVLIAVAGDGSIVAQEGKKPAREGAGGSHRNRGGARPRGPRDGRSLRYRSASEWSARAREDRDAGRYG